MGKPVARRGDTGSHGGSITTGASSILVNGKAVARVGDTYACPKHGPNPIVTGAQSVFGQGQLVAHVGSKTACGATITSGSPDTFVDVPVFSESSAIENLLEEKTYVEFQLLNYNGEPIPHANYIMTLPDGEKRHGKLDNNGIVFIDKIPHGKCDIVFPDIESIFGDQ
jgi:uncharacterized Zn-binding protein involved in type VI secretion